MGLWKNAGVATCLQHDYGYREDAAQLQASMIAKLRFLPGTQISVKRLKKQEIAAWLATTACMRPEGAKADDPTYHHHVQLMIDQEHRNGKIGVAMYGELLECFELMRDA